MKVGNEKSMGLLAAVELCLDGSDEDDYRRWRAHRRVGRPGAGRD